MRSPHLRMAVLAALSSANALYSAGAPAGDIAFDGSLPGTTAGMLNAVNGSYAITQDRGFVNGTNLFHSFGVFNLNQGETALFSGNAAIANIISRVTGGIPTTIDGTLRSSIAGANFWFVNPAGLTVGPTGVIDVSGAIGLGAADFVNFREGLFNATTDASQVTLLVSNPASFGFLETSKSGMLTVQSTDLLSTAASALPPTGLDSEYSMELAGGAGVLLKSEQDINLANTFVHTTPALGGEVVVQAAGSVTIENTDLRTDSGNILLFGLGGISIVGGEQVTLSNSTIRSVGLAGVKPIVVQGGSVQVEDSRLEIFAGAGSMPQRATIKIAAATDMTDARPGRGVVNIVRSGLSTTNNAAVLVQVDSSLGDIAVLGKHVRIENSDLATNGRSSGTGNDILVQGSQSVAIVGIDDFSTLNVFTGFGEPSTGSIVISGGSQGTEITHSILFSKSTAGDGPSPLLGQIGGISITANGGRVTLTDAMVSTNAQGIIDVDDSTVGVTSDIRLAGSSVRIRGGELSTSVDGGPTPNAPNAVDAGDIFIFANGAGGDSAGVVIEGAAKIRSDAVRGGANIQDGVILNATDAGSITVLAPGVRITDGSLLETSAGIGSGSAGSIAVVGGTIELDGATARTIAQSQLTGAGADFAPASIALIATGTVQLDNSTLDAGTTGVIQAGSILVSGSSVLINADPAATAGTTISSSSNGSAAGGDVSIMALEALRIDNSAVSASAGATAAGGGTINLFAGPMPEVDENGLPVPVPGSNAAGNVSLQNTQLTTQTTGPSQAGSINVAGTTIHISGGQVTASTTLDPQHPEVMQSGNAGDISILAASLDPAAVTALVIDNGAQVRSSAVGSDQSTAQVGSAGTITLSAATGTLRIADARVESSASGVDAGRAGQVMAVGASATIDRSVVSVSTESLRADVAAQENPTFAAFTVTGKDVAVNNSTLTATSSGVLSAGSIALTGLASGPDGELLFGSGSVRVNASTVRTSSTGTGNASAAIIGSTGDVLVTNGSSIESSSEALDGGLAGQALVAGGGDVLIDNSSIRTSVASLRSTPDDLSATLAVQAGNAVTISNSTLQATTSGAVLGGGIQVGAGQLRVSGSTLSAESLATGSATLIDAPMASASFTPGVAGSIVFNIVSNAASQILITDSTITTNAVAADGGGITVNANGSEVLLRDSSLVASAGADARGGDIGIFGAAGATLQNSNVLALASAGTGGTINIALAEDVAGPLTIDNSRIATNAAQGDGGSIALDAAGNELLLRGSSIVASAGGNGLGGDISIVNSSATTLQNSQVQALADAGNGGTINIAVAGGRNSSVLLDNSSITTNATSSNGGNISLDAAGGQVTLRGSSIVASAGGTGSGGDISIINAGATTVQDSQLQALASAGSGGTISIALANDSGPVLLDNSTITTNATAANGGNILLDAAGNQLVLRNSSIVASAGGNGIGGDIAIRNAGGATLQDSQIQALANAGAGGTISIDLADGVVAPVLIQRSAITTNAVSAGGGNISLDIAGNTLVLRDSTIRASAGAAGTGGNVLIDNTGLTVVQRSQILARADAGNGGTITINPNDGALFVRDAQSTINADSNSGNDGEVDINSPDTDLNPAVKAQDVGIGSAPELSADACRPAAEAARSTFVREGRGGVSASPDAYLASVESASTSEQNTASTAASEALRVVLLAANTSATEGCR